MGEEAERLNDMYDYDGWYHEQKEYSQHINAMINRYKDNLRADIGTTIRCAYCAKKFIKRTRRHQFCSNKGTGNCKDAYWNNVDDTRRERSHKFS